MLDKAKAAVRWVYNWITVLAGVLAGVPAVILQFIDALGGTDLSPLFPPNLAVKVIATVALVKAICAVVENTRAPRNG